MTLAFQPEDRSVIVNRYLGGETACAIARSFGLSQTPILRILREEGAYAGRRVGMRYPLEDQKDMVRRYNDGESIYRIAKAYGSNHPQSIWHILQAHDVQFRNKNWKGGTLTKSPWTTYRKVKVSKDDPMHAMTGVSDYVMEHRLVMARSLGRPLTRKETVHHLNGDGIDNRLENLQLRNGNHGKGVKSVCLDCGSHNIGHDEL